MFEAMGQEAELAFRGEHGGADRRRGTGARDALQVALTFSSGAIDAVSFLALGKIFTGFMTGNLVFLGMRAAGQPGPSALNVAVSLAAFAAGVFASRRVTGASQGSRLWPREVTAALGLAAFFQAMFLAAWISASGRPGGGVTTLLVGLWAAAMGLQSGAILSLGVRGVFTTAATATVMYLASDLAGKAPIGERLRLAGVVAALCAGAVAGGLLLAHARTYAPLLPLVVTVLVVAITWNPLDPGERARPRRDAGSRNGRRPQGTSRYPELGARPSYGR